MTELAAELRDQHEGGQPFVEERRYGTGAVAVTVIWDKWDHVAVEERSDAILRAYKTAGDESRDRIALAVGLTVPEAHASGLLPYAVLPAVRKTDPVTPEQCRVAMVAEGASGLLDPNEPQLRFATRDEAEASKQRLAAQLPGSEPVWFITKDPGRTDPWPDADSA